VKWGSRIGSFASTLLLVRSTYDGPHFGVCPKLLSFEKPTALTAAVMAGSAACPLPEQRRCGCERLALLVATRVPKPM